MNNSHIAITACLAHVEILKKQNNQVGVDYCQNLIEQIPKAIKIHLGITSISRSMHLTYSRCPFDLCFYSFDWGNNVHHAALLQQYDDYIIGSLFRSTDSYVLEPQLFDFQITATRNECRVIPNLYLDYSKKELEIYLRETTNMVLAINTIINCKNIGYEIHTPSQKLNRKRINKGKLPLFEYRTLTIDSEKLISHSNRAGGSHRSPRFHMRRGHIRHLEAGNIWIQSTTVGNKKLGIIDKDYLVK